MGLRTMYGLGKAIKNNVSFNKIHGTYNGKSASAIQPWLKDSPKTRNINELSGRLSNDWVNRKTGASRDSSIIKKKQYYPLGK